MNTTTKQCDIAAMRTCARILRNIEDHAGQLLLDPNKEPAAGWLCAWVGCLEAIAHNCDVPHAVLAAARRIRGFVEDKNGGSLPEIIQKRLNRTRDFTDDFEEHALHTLMRDAQHAHQWLVDRCGVTPEVIRVGIEVHGGMVERVFAASVPYGTEVEATVYDFDNDDHAREYAEVAPFYDRELDVLMDGIEELAHEAGEAA